MKQTIYSALLFCAAFASCSKQPVTGRCLQIILLFFLFFGFSSCDKSTSSPYLSETKSSLTVVAHDMARQLGVSIDFASVEIKRKDVNIAMEKDSLDLDYDKTTSVIFKLTNGDSVVSTIVPVKNISNLFYNVVEQGTFRYEMIIESSFDHNTNQVYVKEVAGNEKKYPTAHQKWFDCMKGLFASDVGVVIGVAGGAASIGCSVCGAVGAFLIGVGALGCAG